MSEFLCNNGTWVDGAGKPVSTTPVQLDIPSADGRYRSTSLGVLPRAWAEEAYREYSAQFGTGQSLERLEQRGGFGVAECIGLLIDALKRERAR